MATNFIPSKDERALRRRVKLFIENGANPRLIAQDCAMHWSAFEHFIDNTLNDPLNVLQARKLNDWMDAHKQFAPHTKKCSKCGKFKTLDKFYKDSTKKDGRRSICAECAMTDQRERRMGKMPAITKELVEHVKQEDKPDVESKFMAPYFGIEPAMLDEIRAGKHDSLLLTPPPIDEQDYTSAVNALRVELNRIERKLELVLNELGVKVVE